MNDYYMQELNKISGSNVPKMKVTDNFNETKTLGINQESITAFIKWAKQQGYKV